MRMGLLYAVEGFALNLGLPLAVGAQASFVLQQGLARQHVRWVVAICAGCDVVLITAGAVATGMLAGNLDLQRALALPGAGFLTVYGARALRAAWRLGQGHPDQASASEERLASTILATLAVTLLNPHVYLDAFVLLGGAATLYLPPDRLWFVLGAIGAPVSWFTVLGYGAGAFTGLIRHPLRRAALELAVALIMWRTAAKLVGWA